MSDDAEQGSDMYATTLDIIELSPTVKSPNNDPDAPEAPYVNIRMEGRRAGAFPVEIARKMADGIDELADKVTMAEIARFTRRLQDWKNGGDMP